MLQIIDLDDPWELEIEENREAKVKELTLIFTEVYIRKGISNSDLIELTVWLGLLPPIPHSLQQCCLPLAMAIASIRSCTDLSFLFGTQIIMEEIMRIFSLEEQVILLRRLEAKKFPL